MNEPQSSISIRSTAADVIRGNLGELKENLPHPGTIWRWTESPLDKSVQWRLRGKHIIEVDPGWFKTSEKLWAYILEESSANEDVGVSIGQVPLFAPGETPRDSIGGPKVMTGEVSTESDTRQYSLDGEDVQDQVDELNKEVPDRMAKLGRKGGKVTARKRKGELPERQDDQLTIDAFRDDDINEREKYVPSVPPSVPTDGSHSDVAV